MCITILFCLYSLINAPKSIKKFVLQSMILYCFYYSMINIRYSKIIINMATITEN